MNAQVCNNGKWKWLIAAVGWVGGDSTEKEQSDRRWLLLTLNQKACLQVWLLVPQYDRWQILAFCKVGQEYGKVIFFNGRKGLLCFTHLCCHWSYCLICNRYRSAIYLALEMLIISKSTPVIATVSSSFAPTWFLTWPLTYVHYFIFTLQCVCVHFHLFWSYMRKLTFV